MHTLLPDTTEGPPGVAKQNIRRALSTLKQRFDARARRLEIQANIFLVIIIVLLAAGAAAFLFAADIARFDLKSPPSLSEQYQQVRAALKDNAQSASAIEDQIKALSDDSSATADIQ
jgi:hypothetical protein